MRAYANRVEALPMVEDLPLDYAERLVHHRPGRRAVHIHMSRLRARTGKGMVAEINWLDALRDMANFSYVRDLLRLRKWGVAIDGLTATNYAMIDCAALDPDYIKLAWNADPADVTPSRGRDQFLDAVARTAPRKLVLMHCGEQAAVTFGRSLGIGLYQGRYVDAALKQRAAA